MATWLVDGEGSGGAVGASSDEEEDWLGEVGHFEAGGGADLCDVLENCLLSVELDSCEVYTPEELDGRSYRSLNPLDEALLALEVAGGQGIDPLDDSVLEGVAVGG